MAWIEVVSHSVRQSCRIYDLIFEKPLPQLLPIGAPITPDFIFGAGAGSLRVDPAFCIHPLIPHSPAFNDL